MRVRSVKFVHMRASQSGLQQQQGEETAVSLYIIVVFIFSQYYRIEKMLLLATWLKGLRFTNVLRDTLLHRISIVLQWSQVKQYKTYQCTTRDTHSLMNKDVLKIIIKHVTPDMLHVTAGCFYVDISHCTESVSIPPNCWLVMNHTCRLYAWLHIGLALQVKLLLCFHSSSLLPIKNEQCLCNSIQKDSFLG